MVLLEQNSNKIENLNLLAQQAVEGYIIGLHKSPFHGFSIEFSEHRLYNPGDSLRHIDWKVYGKSDKLFVKKYEEETNLRCCIALDISSSMHLPSKGIKKLQAAGIASACILHILKKQLDASALCLFDEKVQYLSAFKSTSNHYSTLIQDLEQQINVAYTEQQRSSTNISHALHELANRLHRKSLVIIFTDFLITDNEALKDTINALQHLKFEQHEVILFHIVDQQLEINFELEGENIELVDIETLKSIKINKEAVKQVYQEKIQQHISYIEQSCLKHQISYERVDIHVPIWDVLTKYLQKRNKLM